MADNNDDERTSLCHSRTLFLYLEVAIQNVVLDQAVALCIKVIGLKNRIVML